MLELPELDTVFPANEPKSLARFWRRYWGMFFLLLPWMLIRQFGITLYQGLGAIWTWNRSYMLIPGKLKLIGFSNLRACLLTAVFGERFTLIHDRDVLIDPGPVFARRQLRRYLASLKAPVAAIVATHAHEEHIGNAGPAAELLKVPIYGSADTLAALRSPERLSWPRRFFIGQPQAVAAATLRLLGSSLETPLGHWQVIPSPGHCEGHASLYDPELGLLFAGDSFLHTVFTSPNRDVSAAEWISTLEAYLQLEIRTMIGTHGLVYTIDPALRSRLFIVRRQDPKALIADKLRFMEWAQAVVREGERRGLPYPVIEACLFPWRYGWSWENWFGDEAGRLFSAGEFSRTHFVRSLSDQPERVPPRFPVWARLLRDKRRKEISDVPR